MRLYRVLIDEDGTTERIEGGTQTEIRRIEFYYAAKNIEQVWVSITKFKDSPDHTIRAIIEEAPSITVLSSDESSF